MKSGSRRRGTTVIRGFAARGKADNRKTGCLPRSPLKWVRQSEFGRKEGEWSAECFLTLPRVSSSVSHRPSAVSLPHPESTALLPQTFIRWWRIEARASLSTSSPSILRPEAKKMKSPLQHVGYVVTVGRAFRDSVLCVTRWPLVTSVWPPPYRAARRRNFKSASD